MKYLTTAAVLLYSTAIGISVALGTYIVSVGLTILAVMINLLNNMMYGKGSNKRKDSSKLFV